MKNEEYLTTKEVAEKLDVTVTTIYNYVKKGKLKPVYDDWEIDGGMLFYKEDIDKLGNERPEGYTTSQVANLLGLHQTTVSKWVKEGKVKAEKVRYKGRDTYFISEDTLNELITVHNKRKYKNVQIYDRKHQVYLYQSLVNQQTNEFARVVSIEKQEGFFLTESGKKLPIGEMAKHGFSPVHQFPSINYLNRVGYVEFKFSTPKTLYDKTYDVLEVFYKAAGHKNIKISLIEESINVRVKPVLLEITDNLAEFLQEHLVQGSIIRRHNGIWLDSELEQLNIEVSKKLKEQLKRMSKSKGVTLEGLVIEILSEATN